MKRIVRFAFGVAMAVLVAAPALSSTRHHAAHASRRAPVVQTSSHHHAAHAARRAPVVAESVVSAPACQGGYLAQTQAQDYLRDDIWVLQPVPDASNRAYRFNCGPN